MKCLNSVLALITTTAAAQTGTFTWELSTDDIHWHSAWYTPSTLPTYVRLRVGWSGIPGALGFANAQFQGVVTNATADSLVPEFPDGLNALNQTLVLVPVGQDLYIRNSGTSQWVNPSQSSPVHSENPIVVLKATYIPNASSGSDRAFHMVLNSTTGGALQVHTPQGIVRMNSTAITVNSAASWGGAGCAFMDYPLSQTVRAHDGAIFTATIEHAASLQWRRNGVPLSDDGHFQGVHTFFLRIADVTRADEGAYDCVADVCSRNLASTSGTLTAACPADSNGDGSLDFADYLDFVQAFADNTSRADYNNDSIVDFFDYLDFASDLALGC